MNNLRFRLSKCMIRAVSGRAMLLILMAYAFSAHANAAPAGALPWEKPMTAIATSLTGPVAYAIGLIGIAIAGGAMLWGGELTEFGRRACSVTPSTSSARKLPKRPRISSPCWARDRRSAVYSNAAKILAGAAR